MLLVFVIIAAAGLEINENAGNKLVKAHVEFNENSISGSGRAESYSVKIKLLELLELKEAGTVGKDLKY
jgi:hypothetical protein